MERQSMKRYFGWTIGLLSTALFSSIAPAAIAQITPDGTLGTESSIVTPGVTINGAVGDRIDGGALRGANLFHSFSEFNVGNGAQVYFANPAGVSSILTRVTGANPSQILGKLGVNGAASLFLINPNGILFGPNASLDVRGSFVASTASSLVFANGEQFSATNPQAAPLLTMNVQPGLQYGQPGGTIVNRATLAAGQDLVLSANNLDLQGQLQAGRNLTLQATDTVRIRDTASEPFVAQAGGKLLVQSDRSVDIFALNHPSSRLISGGDLVLRSANTVGGDAHYWSGGNFRIEQLDGSLGTLYSPHDPIILANGDVSFLSYQGTSLHILAGGRVYIPQYIWILGADISGTAINSTTRPEFATVSLSDGTQISIDGANQPTVDIRAGVDWTQLGGLPGNTTSGISGLPSFGGTATNADIRVGTIFFDNATLSDPQRGQVLLTNQYQSNGSLRGSIQVDATVTGGPFEGRESILTGDALGGGSIFIDSRGDITLNGVIAASALNFSGAYFGNGGDIKLLAQGDILSSSNILSTGLIGGEINIISNGGIIVFQNNQISSGSLGSFSGVGGNVTVKAGDIFLLDGALVSAVTLGEVNSGKLIVEANSITAINPSLDGQRISGLVTQTQGSGNAGNLVITANRLRLLNGARVSTLTFSQGNAGDLIINASESVEVIGTSTDLAFRSNIRSDQTTAGETGNSGDLTINTGRLVVSNGGEIVSGTFGAGNGGNLKINAQQLQLFNEGSISSSTVGSGNAGNLTIHASTVELMNEPSAGSYGGIASDVKVGGTGRGGELNITVDRFKLQGGMQVSVGTLGSGDGGNLVFTATDSIELIGNGYTSGILSQADSSGNAGDLVISAKSLLVRDGASISASTTSTGASGNLTVNAIESVQLIGTATNGFQSSLTASTSLNSALGQGGDAGNLSITTRQLIVQDGAIVAAGTAGRGRGGTLTVNASESVEVMGVSDVLANMLPDIESISRGESFLSTSSGGLGNAGDVRISTQRLAIRDGARVSVATAGQGRGGSLIIEASNSVQIEGSSAYGRTSALSSRTFGSAAAGEIDVKTGELILRNGGSVSSQSRGSGRAGDIDVRAIRSVDVVGTSYDGTPSQVSASTFGSGQGGDLTIFSPVMSIRDGGEISAYTRAQGQAGTLTAIATLLEVAGTSATGSPSSVLFDTISSGDAGELRIDSQRLLIRDGGRVSASTAGGGRGGFIAVNATDAVEVTGTSQNGQSISGLYFDSRGAGDARGIRVNTGQLRVENGGVVTVSGSGTGASGDLEINARSVFLNNGARLTATTLSGEGGNIRIASDSLILLRRDSDIRTQAFGTGDGGNIQLTAGAAILAVLREDSDVIASSITGRGGNIFAKAPAILGFRQFDRVETPESDFVASSEFGIDGTVNIDARNPQTLPSLPGLRDAPPLAMGCDASVQRSQPQSQFLNTNRGGLLPNPADTLSNQRLWQDDRPSPPATSTTLPPSVDRIVEAQSWIKTADGSLILTAQPTRDGTRYPTQLTSLSCNGQPQLVKQ